MGRATQGVKLINLKGKDSIAAVAKVMHEEEGVEIELDDEGNPIISDSEDAIPNTGVDTTSEE